MKAGLVMAFHALAALGHADGVTLLVTGDEELGSPELARPDRGRGARLPRPRSCSRRPPTAARSRPSARASRCTTCAWPAGPRTPGSSPSAGVNATVELAHQVLAVSALGDAGAGTTVTPTAARAGTTTNTVPAEGVVRRRRPGPDRRRAGAGRRRDARAAPGAARRRRRGHSAAPTARRWRRRPRPRCSRARRAVAGRLGLPALTAAAVGGASDGNFTAGVGTPTLDGLGAVGGGAHADDEHVLVDRAAARTALLRRCVADLLADPTDRLEPTGAADHDGHEN